MNDSTISISSHGAGLTTQALEAAMDLLRAGDPRPFGANTLWLMNGHTYREALRLGMPETERVYVATIVHEDGTTEDWLPDGSIVAVDGSLSIIGRQPPEIKVSSEPVDPLDHWRFRYVFNR